MTGCDRTAEFIATINSKREKPQWVQQRRAGDKLTVDPQYREFMRISKECSHRIRDCFEKLERFTVLARKRTVFDDGELTRLIEEIRSDIGTSKSQLDELQSRYKPKQMHSANTVSTLQQRLANVTSNFKSSLEMRSKSVQQQTARHEMFAGPSTSSSSLSLIQANNDNYTASKGPVLLDMNHGVPQYQADPPQQHHLHQHQQQQQQTLLMNDQIDMSERADVMHSIESTIVELGTVFNQLATMVQAQGETITRIDMNISETTGNVEAAHDALLGYFASINSNRWLILKVFMVLFFFFVMFVIFGT